MLKSLFERGSMWTPGRFARADVSELFECQVSEEREVLQEAELSELADRSCEPPNGCCGLVCPRDSTMRQVKLRRILRVD
jgi:hypothetical protein